ncbi:MAG: tryptophan-rich sensory protein [Nanoarchaeota archaeon]|nr:tryptophan-rich sensory protein [Nanoarchaeota archaeon]
MKKGGWNINWKVLIICILVLAFVGFTGSLFTQKSVSSSWYDSIRPSITPPNWVFPVVWNILFLLIAFSLYFAWINARKKRKLTAVVYGVNFNLNMLWSMLFFLFRNPSSAFYQIIVLWLSIVLMITYTWKIDRRASYLLVPYLLWVSFASVLNFLAIRIL